MQQNFGPKTYPNKNNPNQPIDISLIQNMLQTQQQFMFDMMNKMMTKFEQMINNIFTKIPSAPKIYYYSIRNVWHVSG